MFVTNRYDKSEAPSFNALINEEIRIVTDSFECIYGVVQYIIDHNPGEESIKNILPKQHSVELKPSGRVKKHMNRAVTKEMNSTFFSGMHHLEKAEPFGMHSQAEPGNEERLNSWYMGWSVYYSMTQYPSQLKKIEAHIRRRLRSRLVDQQKRKRYLVKKLIKRRVPRAMAWKAVYSKQRAVGIVLHLCSNHSLSQSLVYR